ncbi:hypothetical protein [Bosea sp. OK403]|uniref:hypothetical protein n=1 Tax=Bosea sp. OK403 TaxID=1855286 RepID=UPI001587AF81|nr:hypothetical protein [Bosea sp. OK403]
MQGEALPVAAENAVDILTKRPDIRIVITDIDMPASLDGIALARLVRDRWPSNSSYNRGNTTPRFSSADALGH